MIQLFLTSSFADSYKQLEPFVNDSLENKTVAFFDTASQVEEYSEFKNEALALLEKLKMTVTIIDLNQPDFKEQIKASDIIFVAGGNTFYLLQELRRSGADQLIEEHINSGKLYIGESAGSIIMSPDIDYIKEMDEPEKAPQLESTQALNLIDSYPLPHMDNEYMKDAAKIILEKYQDKLPLHPLNDGEVILVKE
ncbi:Type 1 glutamine amidotransferase-like domain-containing protein [Vagococcus carniphilus]|uniref:Type 1 glutamine amidotransferase-like domain-containing protein n=1 Tax=Vagococcus carniphilus TaxID=218144 RepID=A0AAW8UA16_9ENTE|nr:Type 1 glutamine amidotransferase-like domain-containing protein [Vagococcus carniphilus]MDT2829844.1 Type 1 glutamine amidotransferase-like domain-containing protein [Vagococcus carniphilus]MDT2834831.1 Type 1 glutamine amidotransferase-like domain-containing protein [Vagococcus carniphilus]MDT2854274.1 Type 1 glutamine amidotransferase-like domain-containing protein [Vagococcus carniphilus]